MTKLTKPIQIGGGHDKDSGKRILTVMAIAVFLSICFVPVIDTADAASTDSILTVSGLGDGKIAYSTDNGSNYKSLTNGDNNVPKGEVWIKITSPVYKSKWSSTEYYNTLSLNNINTDLNVQSSEKKYPDLLIKCQINKDTHFLKINGYIYTENYLEYKYSDGSYVMNVDYIYIQYEANVTKILPVLSDKSEEEKFVGWSSTSKDYNGPWLTEVKWGAGSHTYYASYVITSPQDLKYMQETQNESLMIILIGFAIVAVLSVLTYIIKIRKG